MKKVILSFAISFLFLGATSCGGGGGSTCDAYRKADVSKKQSKKEIVKTTVKKVIKQK
ncbi:hypothetical protein [Putridiphycobacter roseus]|uniref:hypothetical protein n=1 Tax=Putridiphycobacter roseus TaxID=2219161 RepID=UPI00131422BA|nr:hypothetical protein [Putridiphycobacter roseus]